MLEQQSIQLSEEMEVIRAQPIKKIEISKKIFSTRNPNPSLFVNANINVLSYNKFSSSLVLNEKFQQYLMEDTHNSNAVIVSFLGRKRLGKSFLVDTLITAETGKTSRSMSKNGEMIINSHPYRLTRESQNNLIFLDCNGEVTSEIFLWTYFLSSTLVYNIEAHEDFVDQFHKIKELLTYVQAHLDTDGEDLSLPQFIIVIRDSNFKELDKKYVKEIENFGLFQLPIQIFNMSYPGTKSVSAKQILDVPIKELNPKYIQESLQLLKQLKLSKEKIIKGNYLSSKILSLATEGVTKNFNKEGKISCSKVWNEVMENLSIGFYNYYLECYEEELNREFESEKPCDKYQISKKLSGIKRKLAHKIENFKNLNDDPIFQKYKQRLEAVIKSKQRLIKEVNKQKSKEANQKSCNNLFSGLNNENCEFLINKYLNSELDDQKSTVLLQNFENILEHRSRTQPKKQSGKENSLQAQIAELERQVNALNNQLKQGQKVGSRQFDLQGKKIAVNKKAQQLKIVNQRYNKQMARVSKSKNKFNTDFQRLDEERQKINEQIKENEKKYVQLREQRSEVVKSISKKLEQQLQAEQEKLKRLEEQLRQAKKQKVLAVPPPPPPDKGCCCALM